MQQPPHGETWIDRSDFWDELSDVSPWAGCCLSILQSSQVGPLRRALGCELKFRWDESPLFSVRKNQA
uniref:Uncharacterized protein n=1 Tax=Vespula pensylvanica TaxID=30213 RepID=A0A834NX78_VESPE|nr:hypothetical protein H0235_010428 [Vespula pensylvanica]